MTTSPVRVASRRTVRDRERGEVSLQDELRGDPAWLQERAEEPRDDLGLIESHARDWPH